MRLSLKYSTSVISSIATTFPSQGLVIKRSPVTGFRRGKRKNETINKKRKSVAAKPMKKTTGQSAYNRYKLKELSKMNINAAIVMLLKPSLCIVIFESCVAKVMKFYTMNERAFT